MAPPIEHRQQALVAHRMNFWGRPSGRDTISWRYEGQTWVVERPDDGQPPSRLSVRCAVCEKSLTFSVHSVQVARGRQKRWRTITYGSAASIVLGLLGFIIVLNVGGGSIWTGIAIVAMVGGFAVAPSSGHMAAEETGITGHFNSWPVAAKHAVTLDRTGQITDLVCARCGHAEEYGRGGVYRDGYPQATYEVAKARLEEHSCPRP